MKQYVGNFGDLPKCDKPKLHPSCISFVGSKTLGNFIEFLMVTSKLFNQWFYSIWVVVQLEFTAATSYCQKFCSWILKKNSSFIAQTFFLLCYHLFLLGYYIWISNKNVLLKLKFSNITKIVYLTRMTSFSTKKLRIHELTNKAYE